MVLLPQPDGPTTATNSPDRTEKLTRSIAVSGETPSGAVKRLVTPTRSSTDAVFSIGLIQRGIDPGELGFQDRRGPGAAFAGRTLDPVALERPGDFLEVLLAGSKYRFQRVGESALLRLQRTAQGLMLEARMDIAHWGPCPKFELCVRISRPHEPLARIFDPDFASLIRATFRI